MNQPNHYFLNSNPACPHTLQHEKINKSYFTLFPIPFALRPKCLPDNLVDIIFSYWTSMGQASGSVISTTK